MKLGKSDLHKFAICHEAEYVDGTDCLKDLPVQPVLPLKTQANIVSVYAFDDIFGNYNELYASRRNKIPLEFVCDNDNDKDRLNEIITEAIDKYRTRIFYFNYYNSLYGWYFSKVYIGTPINGETEYLDHKNNGEQTVTRIKFDMIEVTESPYLVDDTEE